MRLLPSLLLAGLLAATPLAAAERSFTILHSNDWQSRLLGFGPNNEYSPATLNDDDTVGGVARLATLLNERRAAAGDEALLLLDGGDFTMGTLFHTIAREMGSELRLMTELGYDAAVIGNHEFDFRPAGLAAMISAAHKAKGDALLPLLSSNMRFDEMSKADDSLQAHAEAGRILPYRLIERGGIRFGLFGLLGNNAVAVSPMIKPVTFADPVATAREMVAKLREEGAEVVILLSHMGVTQQVDGSWRGEEVELVEQVPGIDIVVGGHSHVALPQPVLVNGRTPVMQAGSEIQYLGELRMTLGDDGVPRLRDYRLHPVNDSIAGDEAITAKVEDFKQVVSERMLAPKGYRFDQPLAKVDQSLGRDFSDHTLANLVTDALRHAVDADLAFTGNGTIRDDLLKGRHGVQEVSDLFRIAPLGVGQFDDDPGYPMIKAYVSAREIKSLLEVLLLAYQLRDSRSYYPRVSGVRFTYNPWRVPFDRVSRIEIGDPVAGYRELDLNDTRLYSIGATSYVGSFTWLVPDLTKGLLDVVPKDAEGRPLPRIEDAIVDQDPNTEGVQELKEWQALLDHIRSLPDLDGDGLADIPTTGAAAEERMIRAPSLHPAELFRLTGPLQWGVSLVILAGALLILWLLSRPLRRRR
ncbi:bifunctional metallophosphatase/5'-nucleotidase [Ectopseudomonas hydrolytica]|uniref:bifunctional metallophosphatase/5'-nucleotidase n=1 Tax=Ectopseudomonas hydrolytica TaxID=2493633 RepID=UPI0018A7DA74|nr:bifunctional UDP-sugar hydrolase/5'-nucleotidase [Pseudomonas hydrolytica]MBF8163877.1 bifunctional metallophosphatase/5'-nucleotidase [Pseudomonas mendocina]UTH32728.1 bifunctional metallophosphatase/5'-nucleotidase [Pseudomonas hydrolytica]UZZ11917.1 bifunctional metallophosphatase/5'-nucleotidase [Pseudomonas mendocina]